VLHILLVEDQASEREIIATAFEHRGVKVTAVGADTQAYEVIRSPGFGEVVAVVTDINLGQGTTGFDIARAARHVRAEVPVVYMTAYDLQTAAHQVPDALMLHKPLRLAEVADCVLDYLQSRQAGGSAQMAGE